MCSNTLETFTSVKIGYYYYLETVLGGKYTRYSLEQRDRGIYGQADSAYFDSLAD